MTTVNPNTAIESTVPVVQPDVPKKKRAPKRTKKSEGKNVNKKKVAGGKTKKSDGKTKKSDGEKKTTNIKRKRLPAKKSIIKKPSSAWIYYSNEGRKKLKSEGSEMSFGEMSSMLSEEWKRMDESQRAKYVKQSLDDKKRYDEERSLLSEEDYKVLREHKRRTKSMKKETGHPKSALSAYMRFVEMERAGVKAGDPSLTFADVGRKMGELWRQMDESDKKKYYDIAAEDKIRYNAEMEKYTEKMRIKGEEDKKRLEEEKILKKIKREETKLQNEEAKAKREEEKRLKKLAREESKAKREEQKRLEEDEMNVQPYDGEE